MLRRAFSPDSRSWAVLRPATAGAGGSSFSQGGDGGDPIGAKNVCAHYADRSPGPSVTAMFVSVSINDGHGIEGVIGPMTMESAAVPPGFLYGFEANFTLPKGHGLETWAWGWRKNETVMYYPFKMDTNPPPSPVNVRLWFTAGACGTPNAPILFDSNDPSAVTTPPNIQVYDWLWRIAF